LSGARALRPLALPAAAPGGRPALRLDSLRRGTTPLRRRRLRDDAAQGDRLDPAAPLRARARAAAGELHERPLEDGRVGATALSRALPAPRRVSGGTARMNAYPRHELEEMLRRWVAANDEAGRTGDWSKMSRFYREDAIYTWNNGPNWEFVARGRQQIHDWVFGT